MYRRSILELASLRRRRIKTWMRAVDNYLNPLCHVFGGSALINQPLSAYRVHGGNYYTQREVLPGVHSREHRSDASGACRTASKPSTSFWRKRRSTAPILQDRFWLAFDQLSGDLRGPGHGLLLCWSPGYWPSSVIATRRCGISLAQVTWTTSCGGAALLSGHLYAVSCGSGGGRLPSWAHLTHEESPVGGQIERAARVDAGAQYREMPLKAAPPRPSARDVRHNLAFVHTSAGSAGPGADCSAAPQRWPVRPRPSPVGYGGNGLNYGPVRSSQSIRPSSSDGHIAFKEYVGKSPGRSPVALRQSSTGSLCAVSDTWTIISGPRGRRRSLRWLASIRTSTQSISGLHVQHRRGARPPCGGRSRGHCFSTRTFLGLRAGVFRPLPEVDVEFDAIYNARFDPLKRHDLTAG